MSTLFEKIGYENIVSVITEFYKRAFNDPMIGHFFFNKDIEDITQKQITFASSMLGSKTITYQGKPLKEAHLNLPQLRPPHFGRRQVLMKEVLSDLNIDSELADQWLKMEDKLKPLIITYKNSCQH